MTGTRIRCVVFDIDDTLYLEREYVRSGFRAVGEWLADHRNLTGVGEQAWKLFSEGVRGNTFDLALESRGLSPDPALLAQLVTIYRRHRPDIRLEPDAHQCLERLNGKLKLAALTDGPQVSQRAKISALGLERWLCPIVLTSELGDGFGKPSPVGFELIMKDVGCQGEECVYVADNPVKDFWAPHALGWRTLRVRRSTGLHACRPSGPEVQQESPNLSSMDAFLQLP